MYHVNGDEEPNNCEEADVPENIDRVTGGAGNADESFEVNNQQSVM